MKYGKVWDNQSKDRLLELAGIDNKQIDEDSRVETEYYDAVYKMQKSFEHGKFDEAKQYAKQILNVLDKF